MIEILLAVYNGEIFLKEQLESIINQSYNNWKILIYDDGSSDGSLKIIKCYSELYKDKIKYIHSETNSGSASEVFSKLMQISRSEYVCFCDQDDVWHKDKLKISLDAMKEIEKDNKDIPILIHTDLFVVDQDLNVIKKSMFKSQHFKLKEKKIQELIVQNNITGCTMLVNKRLISICGKIPKEAIMHDWWLGLIAAAFGKIKFLKQKTVYYRQHGNNVVGAKKVYGFSYILHRLFNKFEIKNSIENSVKQVKIFLNIYKKELKGNRKILEEYLKIQRHGKIRRVFILIFKGYLKDGLIRKIGQIFYI